MPQSSHSNKRQKQQKKPEPRFPIPINPMAGYNFEDVHDAIQHFFGFYRVEEAKRVLAQFYDAWMTSGKTAQLNRYDSDRVKFFYEQLCIVIEASFFLQLERIANGAKLHYIISKPAPCIVLI